MDKIAFIYGETFIYWSPIIMTLAVVTAMLAFLAFYIGSTGDGIGGFLSLPLCLVLSMVVSRFIHWYCRADSYESMESAMSNFSSGAYALMGVFFSCLVVAGVLRLVRITKSLPKMLDAMAIGGSLGIAVGRMSHMFSTTDRGFIIEGYYDMPWIFPVENAVTGEPEYRLATFMIQAMVAGALFVILSIFFIQSKIRKTGKNGDTCLLFMLIYGASQIILDSTRYDSLFMRSNGFISIVQILGAVGVVTATVVFSVRMVKARGFKWFFLVMWVAVLGLVGLAGYMEYYVQRHGDMPLYCYSTMTTALLGAVGVVVLIRLFAVTAERKAQRKQAQLQEA